MKTNIPLSNDSRRHRRNIFQESLYFKISNEFIFDDLWQIDISQRF